MLNFIHSDLEKAVLFLENVNEHEAEAGKDVYEKVSAYIKKCTNSASLPHIYKTDESLKEKLTILKAGSENACLYANDIEWLLTKGHDHYNGD